jgi:hypothetical protein
MPTLRSHTHLQAAQADTQTKACKRVCLPNRTRTLKTQHDRPSTERRAACNSGFKKLAVQLLIEHSTSHKHLWWLDSFVLRNPLLRQAPKRYWQVKKNH